jgi:hypothetical protein
MTPRPWNCADAALVDEPPELPPENDADAPPVADSVGSGWLIGEAVWRGGTGASGPDGAVGATGRGATGMSTPAEPAASPENRPVASCDGGGFGASIDGSSESGARVWLGGAWCVDVDDTPGSGASGMRCAPADVPAGREPTETVLGSAGFDGALVPPPAAPTVGVAGVLGAAGVPGPVVVVLVVGPPGGVAAPTLVEAGDVPVVCTPPPEI